MIKQTNNNQTAQFLKLALPSPSLALVFIDTKAEAVISRGDSAVEAGEAPLALLLNSEVLNLWEEGSPGHGLESLVCLERLLGILEAFPDNRWGDIVALARVTKGGGAAWKAKCTPSAHLSEPPAAKNRHRRPAGPGAEEAG